jgi:hypothetical protein
LFLKIVQAGQCRKYKIGTCTSKKFVGISCVLFANHQIRLAITLKENSPVNPGWALPPPLQTYPELLHCGTGLKSSWLLLEVLLTTPEVGLGLRGPDCCGPSASNSGPAGPCP